MQDRWARNKAVECTVMEIQEYDGQADQEWNKASHNATSKRVMDDKRTQMGQFESERRCRQSDHARQRTEEQEVVEEEERRKDVKETVKKDRYFGRCLRDQSSLTDRSRLTFPASKTAGPMLV
jgi:hypothetical protein